MKVLFASWATITALAITIAVPLPRWGTAQAALEITDAAHSAERRFVTLITGDRIAISAGARPVVEFQYGEGRKGVSYSTTYELVPGERHEHVYVVPSDAQALIATDQIDRQLFDVTAMLEARYDDAASGDLPLLVTYSEASRGQASAGVQSIAGELVLAHFESANAALIRPSKSELPQFWKSLAASGASRGGAAGAFVAAGGQVKKVWLDRALKPALDRSVAQIGAPVAWRSGYTGKGVTVAVIDSGVDASHPDLAGKVVAAQRFVGADDLDNVGHGTHVAATIAGSGAASAGRYKGVAPDAQIVSAKVCELTVMCPQSAILAGMEWAVREMGARIVNMSLGGPDTEAVDPVEQSVDWLTSQYGTLFVVAAGNEGVAESIGSPASADAALAVAAVDRENVTAYFSSRGPRLDGGAKPDISAPGVQIVAARAQGTHIGTPVGELHATLSGTSMATPHVAGVAALLKQRYPEWDATRMRAALMSTAVRPTNAGVFEQGAGRVDAAAALNPGIWASPSTLNLGVAHFPHEDDEPIHAKLVYSNNGTQAASVSLRIEVRGPSGELPPAGMFTITPAQLSIPVGGSAEATITVDTRRPAEDGLYSGWIVSNGGREFAVPLSLTREEESYDLQLDYATRDAGVPHSFNATLFSLDRPAKPLRAKLATDGSQTALVRARKGRYELQAFLTPVSEEEEEDSGTNETTVFVQPVLEMTSDVNVLLDGRQAKLIDVRTPRLDAPVIWQHLGWENRGRLQADFVVTGAHRLYTAHLGPTDKGFTSFLSAQARYAPLSSQRLQRPQLYAYTWSFDRVFPTGLQGTMRLDKMARVDAHYAAPPSAVIQGSVSAFSDVGGRVFPMSLATKVQFPYDRTEYYGTERGTPWVNKMNVDIENEYFSYPVISLISAPKQHRVGHSSVSWAQAPYAPFFTFDRLAEYARRRGDTMMVSSGLPLFGDRGGHSGIAVLTRARTALYEDGKLLQERLEIGGTFQVGSSPATYRLQVESEQQVLSLSSKIEQAWTFSSKQPASGAERDLPLMTVRIEPQLNEQHQARAGSTIQAPISVWRNGQAHAVESARVKIEASFDEGVSWRAVPVSFSEHGQIAHIRHPRSASFVSLRAVAADQFGNSVEQTVIKAYALAPN